LNNFRIMLWTKFKNENELWFLCTALLLNEIYLPMKFHVDALHCLKVMFPTKKGRTGGRLNHYMPPFRGIKSVRV